MENVKLMLGDNIESLKQLPDNFVDSIVTDPPYGLSFMNKKWDYDVPSVDFWKEVYRVLKPGGHILSFGGTRTYHRMVVNIEDAGFEIRDQIMWVYGSGFPKSLNIGKGIDKKLGNDREVVGDSKRHGGGSCGMYGYEVNNKITKGNSEYEGWGTGLKPANEPIVLARKPLSEKTIVDNVLRWGTGGINVDGCRIETTDNLYGGMYSQGNHSWDNESHNWGHKRVPNGFIQPEGRFPANFIIDEEASKILDEQSGEGKSTKYKTTLPKIAGNNIFNGGNNGNGQTDIMTDRGYEDTGGASRFFYVPKVSKKERNMGLDGFEDVEDKGSIGLRTIGGTPLYEKGSSELINTRITKNNHPTVKPINLLTYLVRLITPPNGIVLDPYMGSGSTGIAVLLEGFEFIGMEMDEDYFNIAEGRINNWEQYKTLVKK
jgi:site-specific DNA-methyltransferase (adenine-specific)